MLVRQLQAAGCAFHLGHSSILQAHILQLQLCQPSQLADLSQQTPGVRDAVVVAQVELLQRRKLTQALQAWF